MTRHPALRISIVAAAVALVVLLGVGGYNQRRLADLRATHQKRVRQAAAHGILHDPTRLEPTTRITKRPRLDSVAEAKRISAEFLAHASKSESLGEFAEHADRQRMMVQMDQVMALNGDQLKIFIEEIHAAAGRLQAVGDTASSHKHLCDQLLGFAIRRLAMDHPKDALELMVDSPDLMQVAHATSSSLTTNGVAVAMIGWADSDPVAAMDWFRQHEGRLGILKKAAQVSLILSACLSDPPLAVQFIHESGDSPEKWVSDLTLGYEGAPREVRTPERWNALLTLLHHWRADMADDAPARQEFDDGIRRLAFGSSRRETFESVTGWIEGTGLSVREIGSITQRFADRVNISEIGRWIDWLGQNLPADPAGGLIGPLMERWTQSDHQAAEGWLVAVPDGVAKHVSIRAYAETISKYEPEAAIEWAATLPAGEQRDETYQRIHHNWPKEDQQAAESFAEKHRLK